MNQTTLDHLRKTYLDIKMSEGIHDYHHIPVLLKESIHDLITDPDGIYVDVTFGGGGHSREILSRLGSKGRLFAFDRDRSVLSHIPDDNRFELIISNYMYLKKYMEYYKIERVHGILADLGLSSHHLDVSDRGFSIHSDSELDMRMNLNQTLTAKDVIMTYPVQKLEYIIKNYGELTNAKRIATHLVKDRGRRNFNSCKEFAEWASSFSYGRKNKFLAQLFQAIRIEVNHEIESLKHLIKQSAGLLHVDGRLVVISYHSLEDRLVKQWFKRGDPDEEGHMQGSQKQPFRSLHKQAIKPDLNEINNNSRARSAKMRTGIKQKVT